MRKELTINKKRNRYSAEVKAEVALPALRTDETMGELATRFGFHPTVIKDCMHSLLGSAAEISSSLDFGKLFISQIRMEL